LYKTKQNNTHFDTLHSAIDAAACMSEAAEYEVQSYLGAGTGQVLTAIIYGNGIISLTDVQTEEAIQQAY
jgi:predicted Zn-dependent protease